jgi:phosphatidylserine/phosphatidylglycerophosphate/cardiolipin synthase-like enzyme
MATHSARGNPEREAVPDAAGGVLVPGQTCWRIETAGRFALIIDAAAYFQYAKAAMLKAKSRIVLIGWDFDVRIRFEPEGRTLDGPNRLGDFLAWLPEQRPGLRVYVLKWDLGVIQSLGRGMAPLFLRNWTTGKRLRFKLDGVHPPGAAHHQKIVAIDDALAFCGGIDITVDRWDTREHRDRQPCRVNPNGEAHGPWHDATAALDGEAALAIGDLARARWRDATGETLERIPAGNDPWPDGLVPTIEHVQVAIARTLPELDDREPVTEIERLYLDAIASARRSIYLESQYLASRELARALAARLREPDGPEIVLILPESAEGWLEQEAMDGARVLLLRLLWDADTNRRFGAFYPVTEGGEPIYVHAKIMIIDDVLLRVGSSNLNNRSLGFDTECDLALEAAGNSPDDERLRETIRRIRTDLLREHLDVDTDELSGALEQSGSLLDAIENLRGRGRTLRRFDPADVAGDESAFAENDLLDPEQRAAGFVERLVDGCREFAARSGKQSSR